MEYDQIRNKGSVEKHDTYDLSANNVHHSNMSTIHDKEIDYNADHECDKKHMHVIKKSKHNFKEVLRCVVVIVTIATVFLLSLCVLCLLRMYVLMSIPAYDSCLSTGVYRKVPPLDNQTIGRLQSVIREETVIYGVGKFNNASFLSLHETLEELFPLIHNHSKITRTVINTFSLLYKIEGTNTKLKPYLFSTHLDVVPVEGQDWTVNPFGGVLKDGYIYGRGTLDMKQILVAILESVEGMIRSGHVFQRSFYITCGHDEEVFGFDGASKIAEYLEESGLTELDYIIDEGVPILDGIFKSVDKPVLIVGVAEKGVATLELSVTGRSGHSSLPSYPSNLGVLARAVVRLEEKRQPIYYDGLAKITFTTLAPYMSFLDRLMLSNLWMFSGVVLRKVEKSPINNAIIRTTTSITQFHSGIKDNVIPETAKAILNHRLHPSQTFEDVLAVDAEVMDDPRVKITTTLHLEASEISGTDTYGYHVIRKAVSNIFPGVIVVPGLCIARTDSFKYKKFTKNIYRLNPIVVSGRDIGRIHGKDERISVEEYRKEIEFYTLVIKLGEQSTLECHSEH